MEKEYLIIFFITILLVFRYSRKNFYIYSFFTLPATFFHELTHLVMSVLLNGRPISFNIFPKKTVKEDYVIYELGYVTSTNITWYNSLFIGLSPLLLFISAYLIYLSININELNTETIMKILIIPFLLEGGLPSIPDIKIAFSKSFIYLGIIIFIVYFYPNLLNDFFINLNILWINIQETIK